MFIVTFILPCSIVFAGFSAESLRSRILDGEEIQKNTHTHTHDFNSLFLAPASASVVITTDQGVRGGKVIPLKETVDEAVAGCECVKKVFVSKRTGANIPMNERDILLEEVRGAPS